jgi:hypothetical protein
MNHQDGHCATPGETIYVKSDSSVCVTIFPFGDPGSGTVMKPLCSMDLVPMLLTSSRSLVLVRGTVSGGTWTFTGQGGAALSIIGQNSGLIAGGASPAFSMQNASAYLRDLKLSLSATGISEQGGTLVLDGVTVDGSSNSSIGISVSGGVLSANKLTVDSWGGGGILLDGAAFDIRNATVTGNGPGIFNGLTQWGGVLINNPPGGSAKIQLSTVQNNMQTGITCSTATSGSGVLATGNTGSDINPTCGFSPCGTASSTCGAQ